MFEKNKPNEEYFEPITSEEELSRVSGGASTMSVTTTGTPVCDCNTCDDDMSSDETQLF